MPPAAPTLADRVLAHLARHPVEIDAQDVPREVTQEGISDLLGVRVAHVSRALKNLVDDGLVRAHLAHPRGGARRARAHALTQRGVDVARSIRLPPPERVAPKAAEAAPLVRTPAGREPQMAALIDALERVRKGAGPVVALIEGDAGCGKTRLLSALCAEAARRGATVALGQGAPVGDAQLVGPLGAALSPLGFERRYRARDAGSPRERALSAAVDSLVAAAREEAVVVALDDLHHAGASVADFMHGLTIALPRGTRVLLAVAFRREETWQLPNGPLYTALDPLRTMSGAVHVELGPLDKAGIAALLEDAGVHVKGERKLPDELVERVWRESGGNSLYALSMGEALADGVDESDFFPPTVRADATQHFASLPKDVLDVLQLAAVAGAEVDYGVLARGAEVDERRLVASLDVLLDRLILEEVPGGGDLRLRFRHPKVREALLADLSATRRRFLESRASGAGTK